jgi:hypothetical protein
MDFSYVADGIQSAIPMSNFSVVIEAGRQLMIPDVVQYIREHSGQKIGRRELAWPEPNGITGRREFPIFLGARTSTLGAGGRFGVCYSAVVPGDSGRRLDLWAAAKMKRPGPMSHWST